MSNFGRDRMRWLIAGVVVAVMATAWAMPAGADAKSRKLELVEAKRVVSKYVRWGTTDLTGINVRSRSLVGRVAFRRCWRAYPSRRITIQCSVSWRERTVQEGMTVDDPYWYVQRVATLITGSEWNGTIKVIEYGPGLGEWPFSRYYVDSNVVGSDVCARPPIYTDGLVLPPPPDGWVPPTPEPCFA